MEEVDATFKEFSPSSADDCLEANKYRGNGLVSSVI